jgi:hypothetical protein
MRTTVRLDDDLLRAAKTTAAATGQTLTQVIEDALRESLGRRDRATNRRRFVVRTFKGNGLLPGVDLDDSAALLELMDRRDATP